MKDTEHAELVALVGRMRLCATDAAGSEEAYKGGWYDAAMRCSAMLEALLSRSPAREQGVCGAHIGAQGPCALPDNHVGDHSGVAVNPTRHNAPSEIFVYPGVYFETPERTEIYRSRQEAVDAYSDNPSGLVKASDVLRYVLSHPAQVEDEARIAKVVEVETALLLALDACRLVREHKPVPWDFLEQKLSAALTPSSEREGGK